MRHAELLVLNKAVDPTSKAGVFEWATGTACPAFLGVPRSAEIDITAAYMEGTKCVIAEYGYAPGGKRGHKQIKIALGVTKDGYPFYWKVLKAKTSDKTTVTKVIAETQELFQIADCTFVFDRGMATFDNFRFVEANGCTYLSALNSDTVRSMRFPGVSALSSITVEDAQALADQLAEDAGLARIPKELSDFTLYAEGKSFYKTISAGSERYILVFNPELLVTRRQDREARIAKAEAEIAEINKDAMSAKKSRAPEPMLAKAKAILSRLALTRVFEPVIDEALITCNSRNGSTPSEIRTTERGWFRTQPPRTWRPTMDSTACARTFPKPNSQRNRPYKLTGRRT
jgi:transposase